MNTETGSVLETQTLSIFGTDQQRKWCKISVDLFKINEADISETEKVLRQLEQPVLACS